MHTLLFILYFCYISLQIETKDKKEVKTMMFAILIGLFVTAWVAAAVIGSQAYFRGEQRKPIHERNWDSESFDVLAKSVTGKETNYSDRIPAYRMDAYASSNVSN